jgi:single-stranded-DNA-specific exonuclease
VLSLDQVSIELAQAIRALSPFGPGNKAPILALRDLTLVSSALIGRTREHRRMVVRDGNGCERTVLWWRSADQPTPEGTFDLAVSVGINRFQGEESVQLTWVDARVTSPPTIEVAPRPSIAVLDHRAQARHLRGTNALENRPQALRALWTAVTEVDARPMVWGEAVSPNAIPDASFCGRYELTEAETLVVWTTPPGPDEFHAALENVSPHQVVLVSIDPGLDTLRTFFERLAGLTNYALHRDKGRIPLSRLAAAMAHSEGTVRLGLEWMAQKGHIDLAWEGAKVVLHAASRGAADRGVGEGLRVVQGQLWASLEETAAYRAYFAHADAARLVNG